MGSRISACRSGATWALRAMAGTVRMNSCQSISFFLLIPQFLLRKRRCCWTSWAPRRHALRRGLQVRADVESVVITGAGPVGLGVLAMARLLLGTDVPVLIADMVPYRLRLAEQLGGLAIDLNAQSLADGAHDQRLESVDLALDTSGKSAARQASLDLLGKRGVLVCVGHGGGLTLTVSPDLIAPERAVLGSEYFCYHELPASLDLLRRHMPYLRQIITHRYPVHAIQQVFELFFTGQTGKVLIEQ